MVFRILIILQIATCGFSQPVAEVLPVMTHQSFRALSVVNKRTIWVGGTESTVGRSNNGGRSWSFVQLPVAGLDIRSVYGFNKKIAIAANAGSPALIFRTVDGGRSWEKVYENHHPAAFIDGLDFWNRKRGLVYGDPLDGIMLLLSSEDGGQSWNSCSSPPALLPGEASFAASGTGIRCYGRNRAVILTGGLVSRCWYSADGGRSWQGEDLPVEQGNPAAGAFSIGISPAGNQVIVGGDFRHPEKKEKHVLYRSPQVKEWMVPESVTRGYRESVEHLRNSEWIAVGPTGMEWSPDNGKTWLPVSDETGFHVVRRARKGKLVIAAGNGKLARVR